jgi:RHS repeat-associated protein
VRAPLLASSFPFLDGTYRVSQVFNDLGLPASTTYPAECFDGDCTNLAAPLLTVSMTYKNGFLGTITNGGTSYVDGITYQANGLISTVVHHNGTNENWTPDIHGMSRPCSITLTVPGVIQNNSTDPCNNQSVFWTSGAYGYDGAGNIKYINFTPYTYDKVSRLTVAGGETFTYDIFGNITNHTGNAISVDSNTNRLAAGATYDAVGNLATWNDPTGTSTRTVTYQWDALGSLQHLTDNGSVAHNPLLPDQGTGTLDTYHVYTADDERVATVELPLGQFTAFPIKSLRYTLRGFGNELLSTYTLGAATNGWLALYRTENDIWRGSQLAAIDTPTGIQHFALDHLGSPRVITDASGNVLSQPVFAPFGTGGVTGTTALQFTGHERDSAATADTLDYMHARFYTPGLGRFLSVDPVIDVKGAGSAPQAWNRYTYGANNPLRYRDPTGKYTCQGDAAKCNLVYQQIDSLPRVRDALDKNDPQRAQLSKVIKALGKKGDSHTRVGVVAVDPNGPNGQHAIPDGTKMLGAVSTTGIALSFANIERSVEASGLSTKDMGTLGAEMVGANIVHETIHSIQNMGATITSRAAHVQQEIEAYSAEASYYAGTMFNAPNGLWSSGNGGRGYNSLAIYKGAVESTNVACQAMACPP